MATSTCFKRLQKELVSIQKSPVEHISTAPNDTNILEWHYVIEGPTGSPYEGGFYHGVLKFPKDYPFKPPSILMFTRNGRFKQNVRLCLSMSDYHPESWNPMWSVASILSGLMSFMLDTQSTLGSMEATDELRKQYARESLQENMKNSTFKKLFPQYVKLAEERSKAARGRERDVSAAAMAASAMENSNEQPPASAGGSAAIDEVRDADMNGNGVEQQEPVRRASWRRLAMVLGTTVVTATAVLYGMLVHKPDIGVEKENA